MHRDNYTTSVNSWTVSWSSMWVTSTTYSDFEYRSRVAIFLTEDEANKFANRLRSAHKFLKDNRSLHIEIEKQ